MSAEHFFSDAQKAEIRKAIEMAEEKTSGEIRVHIQEKCKGNGVKTAEKVFAQLKMHKTKLRNGVLFFLAIDSRVFAIYGDKGIHEKVPANFWNEISSTMEDHFRKGDFTGGLTHGIKITGEQLAKHFPHQDSDKNELTNEISFK